MDQAVHEYYRERSHHSLEHHEMDPVNEQDTFQPTSPHGAVKKTTSSRHSTSNKKSSGSEASQTSSSESSSMYEDGNIRATDPNFEFSEPGVNRNTTYVSNSIRGEQSFIVPRDETSFVEKLPQTNSEQEMDPAQERDGNSDGMNDDMGRGTMLQTKLSQIDEGYRHSSVMDKRKLQNMSPLLRAAQDGRVAEVNSLLIRPNTDILRREPMHGQSALHLAVRGGHLNVVRVLMMPHVVASIINLPDGRRNTALHLAAAKSRRMTNLLLQNGADVSFRNMKNQTPLGVHILTTERDDPTMAEYLLQAHSDPNARIGESTCLHVAVDKSLFNIATRLVRYGARLDAKDEQGRTVFAKIDEDLLKRLLSKISHPPVWIPDKEEKHCMVCSRKFGTFGARRHHCRFCGRICCSRCSHHHLDAKEFPRSFRVAYNSKKKESKHLKGEQRVCDNCSEILSNPASNEQGASN